MAQAAQAQQTNALQVVDKKFINRIADEVMRQRDAGKLVFPPDYSVENAMASAYIAFQSTEDKNHVPAAQACTPKSIANAFRDMAYMGLTPSKKQCYFIVHGDELTLRRSYFGDMMLAKRVDPRIEDFEARIVYKGDIVETDIIGGRQVVTMHKGNPFAKQSISDALGAYCNVIYKDGHYTSTIMTIDEIHRGWSVGNAQLGSKAHKLTPEEMIKRSVTRRACKTIINTSTDRTLFGKALRKNDMESSRAERDETVHSRTNVVDVDFEQATPKELPDPDPAPAVELPAEETIPETDDIPAITLEPADAEEPPVTDPEDSEEADF